MNSKQFARTAGVIFAVVCILHLLRVLMGWPLIIGAWEVPVWLSIVVVVITGSLAYAAWRLR